MSQRTTRIRREPVRFQTPVAENVVSKKRKRGEEQKSEQKPKRKAATGKNCKKGEEKQPSKKRKVAERCSSCRCIVKPSTSGSLQQIEKKRLKLDFEFSVELGRFLIFDDSETDTPNE